MQCSLCFKTVFSVMDHLLSYSHVSDVYLFWLSGVEKEAGLSREAMANN